MYGRGGVHVALPIGDGGRGGGCQGPSIHVLMRCSRLRGLYFACPFRRPQTLIGHHQI